MSKLLKQQSVDGIVNSLNFKKNNIFRAGLFAVTLTVGVSLAGNSHAITESDQKICDEDVAYFNNNYMIYGKNKIFDPKIEMSDDYLECIVRGVEEISNHTYTFSKIEDGGYSLKKVYIPE